MTKKERDTQELDMLKNELIKEYNRHRDCCNECDHVDCYKCHVAVEKNVYVYLIGYAGMELPGRLNGNEAGA